MTDSSADPAALLVATFKFNEITIEQGYIEADRVSVLCAASAPRGTPPASSGGTDDEVPRYLGPLPALFSHAHPAALAAQDEDGKVSEEDLVGFCKDVQLGCSEDAVRAFYRSMDTQGAGYVEEAAWVGALRSMEQHSEQLLASRGVSSVGTGAHGTAGMPAAASTLGSQATGTAMDVDAAADQLAAALQYNELSLATGFEELDQDGDSKISIDDLRAAVSTMGLNISDGALAALHAGMDSRGNGLIELESWCAFLANRNTAEVLLSRGVDESQLSIQPEESQTRPGPATVSQQAALEGQPPVLGSDYAPSTGGMTRVEIVSNTIAALLDYNNLTVNDGFEAFDVDEDNLVSWEDLEKAAQQLELGVDSDSLMQWFQLYNKSGGRDEAGRWQGAMTLGEWRAVIEASNPTDVLASRGVSVGAPEPDDAGGAVGQEQRQPATSDTANDIEAAAEQLAAALRYNSLDAQSGFEALDVDGDERISVAELCEAAQNLGLLASPGVLVQLHSAMDDRGDGLVQLDSWTRFLDAHWGNSDSVLKSRGVTVEGGAGDEHKVGAAAAAAGEQPADAGDQDEAPAEAQTPVINSGTFNTASFAHVQDVSDTIAALLDYNELSHLDGFEAFDVDEDDKVSLTDLTTAADKMALDVSPEKLAEWFKVVNVAGSGMISFEEWDAALGYARSEDVLRSRGVVLVDSGGADFSLDDSSASLPLNSAPVPETGVPPLVNLIKAQPEPPLREEPDTCLPKLSAAKAGDVPAQGTRTPAPPAPAAPDDAVEASGAASVEESVGVASVASAPLTPNSALRKVTDTMAALLQYSGLSVEDGFGEFDVDQDGRISLADLTTSAEALDLDLSAADLQRWYEAMDPAQPPVGIAQGVWIKELGSADADKVLRSRGVDLSELPAGASAADAPAASADAAGATPQGTAGGMSPQDVSDHLAALLQYNELALPDAFREFDDDCDGKVSQLDFDLAAAQLQVEVTSEDLKAWHRHFNTAGDGYMSEQEWMAALRYSRQRPIASSKEPCHILERALLHPRKSPVAFSKVPCSILERSLLHPRKSPIASSKEPYMAPKRDVLKETY